MLKYLVIKDYIKWIFKFPIMLHTSDTLTNVSDCHDFELIIKAWLIKKSDIWADTFIFKTWNTKDFVLLCIVIYESSLIQYGSAICTSHGLLVYVLADSALVAPNREVSDRLLVGKMQHLCNFDVIFSPFGAKFTLASTNWVVHRYQFPRNKEARKD